MVDEYQHIVYDSPELTPAERNEKWLELERKYRPYMDFGDVDFYSNGRGWQRQLHINLYPFYYIDYCLAQTAALEFWSLSQKIIKMRGRDICVLYPSAGRRASRSSAPPLA